MIYEVTALRGREYISIRCEAVSDQAAIHQVKSRGYSVVSTRPILANWADRYLRRERFPLMLFSQELLALLEAGLNLMEALDALTEKEHRPVVREVLQGVLRLLNEGQPISTAMENFPSAFPSLYVAAIRASEKMGGMPESLRRYIAYQSQIEQVRKKVISASIYPAILLVVGSLVIFFLMGYVVPRFSHIYEDVGGDIPFLSQLMLSWGNFISNNVKALLFGTLGLIVTASYLFTRPTIRASFMAWVWRIPAVGERMRIYQLARFYRSLSMLLIAGIPILTALNMVSGLLSPSLRIKLQSAAEAIRQGHALSSAMEQNGLSTPVALRMLRVGERSGSMGEMMERISAFYDEETARWIEWFTKLFEPLLMLSIGSVVGLVVLLLYMPIFDLAGNIK